MSTPESRVKDKVKRLLKQVAAQRGVAYRMDWNAGSAYMNTLDGVGVFAGNALVMEIKRFDENETPTARQQLNLRDFRAAGAATFDIVDETALAYLKYWLETVEPREPYEP
jgi:hypothetical protein